MQVYVFNNMIILTVSIAAENRVNNNIVSIPYRK